MNNNNGIKVIIGGLVLTTILSICLNVKQKAIINALVKKLEEQDNSVQENHNININN